MKKYDVRMAWNKAADLSIGLTHDKFLEKFAEILVSNEREKIATWYEQEGWILPATEGANAIRNGAPG